MSLINITDLTFAYDGSYDTIFDHVSFQIDTDWKLGFTGRNGRGKTTFLNLLMGKYEYSGSISASVQFELFPFPIQHPERMTMEILEEISPDVPFWQLQRELSLLEVEEDVLWRAYETLSNGERTKVQLAALFLRENNYLLIDEPTNHLDLRGRALVSRYLRSKQGFLLVSHDRAFLDGCVDHILSINKSSIEVCRGDFSTWLENRERRDHFEQAENDKLKKEIRRLSDAAREKAAWSDRVEKSKYGDGSVDTGYIGHQSARMMGRAKAIETRRQKAVEEKSLLLKDLEKKEDLKLVQQQYHTSRMILARDLGIQYIGKPVFDRLTFTVEQGDRVALTGKNGSGKSSLLKLLCGQEIPHTGILEIGSRLRISYVPQDTSGLCGGLREFVLQRQISETQFKTILRKLDFSREQFEKDMSDFSEGQKKKVLLAASLCEDAHLHIWDEPMNYIDVISRIQLEELLLRFRPTLLFVEHDKVFCDKIATKTISL